MIKSSINKYQLENIIPVLSEKDRQEILAYYMVYEKYEEEFAKKATEDLKDHPVFGKLIKEIPKEISEANNKLSSELQRDAIINDNWLPYIEYQTEQGIAYAKMGLDFKSWYEVVVLVKKYMTPLLYDEYVNSSDLLASLNGMNRFMGIAMSIIGEAYLYEKQEIILEERQKINKLNEELEQKVIDRTEQLQNNLKRLEESEEKFQKAFQISAAGISISRLSDSVYVDVNDSFSKMIGFSKEEIINQSSKESGLIINALKREELLQEFKKHGFAKNMEMTLRHKSGKILQVLASTEIILLKDIKYVLTLIYDISDRKKEQEQLEAVNKELEAFSYSVSHDLRAPLRAVNGYAQMLIEDYGPQIDEEGNRIVQNIKYNATKMGTLIDDLLAFSRLGRKDVQKREIDLKKMLEDVIIELNKTTNHQANIKIGKLHKVKADYGLLYQAIFNLVSNSVKYSSKKTNPQVEINSEEKNGEIIFSIKDNGAGFDMKYVNKLFGVFQRLHSQEEFDGTGVGLAIVQRVIAKHNGKVWAEGKINEGAIFHFSLTND